MVYLDNLSPCLSYWVVVTAMDCIHQATSPPLWIGVIESVQSGMVVTVRTGINNIEVIWRSRSAIVQQEIRSVQVTVTSECPTGIVPSQTQVFTLTPDEGTSVNIRGLGMWFENAFAVVSARVCNTPCKYMWRSIIRDSYRREGDGGLPPPPPF